MRSESNLQATEKEDTDELYLPASAHLQSPDHWDRQQNDGKIREDVDCTGNTCGQQDIDAAPCHALVPCLVHGGALEYREEDFGDVVGRNDERYCPKKDREASDQPKYPMEQ